MLCYSDNIPETFKNTVLFTELKKATIKDFIHPSIQFTPTTINQTLVGLDSSVTA